jgi:hypothetical protein
MKAAAEPYLTDSPRSIGEGRDLLGYSEPAALTRAFRRWKCTQSTAPEAG